MTEKKFLTALAVAAVGLNLILAGGVAAKPSHCAKDCKQDIKGCLALVPNNKSCTGTKAEKKACRRMYAAQRKICRGMVKRCKQQNPSLSGTCVPSTTTTSTTTPTTSPLPANTTTTSLPTTTTSRTTSSTRPTTTTTSITTPSTTTTTTAAPTTTTTRSTSTSTTTPTSSTTLSTSSTTSTTLVSGCFTDTGDGTIHDTCTGLQWEKKDGVVGNNGNAADLHDVNNFYSWAGCCNGDCSTIANYCQPNAAAATTCAAHADGGTQGCSTCASGTCNVEPGSSGAITTVWDWINQVNAANFAGHSDWRLPSEGGCNSCYMSSSESCSSCSPHELETILLAPYPCFTFPCINAIFGPRAGGFYWSASTNTAFPSNAWSVSFTDGAADVDGTFNDASGRAVR